MIEVLDEKPVFHPMVRTGSDTLLHSLPSIKIRFLTLLCKTGDFIAKSIGLAHREELNNESIGTLIPRIYRMDRWVINMWIIK